MELKFSYSDGSSRIIRPSEEFFRNIPKATLRDKIDSVAHDTGVIHQVDLYMPDGRETVIVRTTNCPIEKDTLNDKQYARGRRRRRHLRKEHIKNLENNRFTVISKDGHYFSIEDIKNDRKKRRKQS